MSDYRDWLKSYGRNVRPKNNIHMGRWFQEHFKRGGLAGRPRSKRGPKPEQAWF